MKTSAPAPIDDYIAKFPDTTQARLLRLRATIKKAAPKAEERIGYDMPGYYLNGPLVYFAAYKAHIGVYPTPLGIAEFEEELSVYVNAKGSVQFPLDKPMPWGLITRIVKARVKANLAKAK